MEDLALKHRDLAKEPFNFVLKEKGREEVEMRLKFLGLPPIAV